VFIALGAAVAAVLAAVSERGGLGKCELLPYLLSLYFYACMHMFKSKCVF